MSKYVYAIFVIILIGFYFFRLESAIDQNNSYIQPNPLQGMVSTEVEHTTYQSKFRIDQTWIKTHQIKSVSQGDEILVSGTPQVELIEGKVKKYYLIYSKLDLIHPYNNRPTEEKLFKYPHITLARQTKILRDQLNLNLQKLFSADEAALLSGMVLGQKNQLSLDLYQDFKNSGLLHIVVASGGNIILLASVLFFIFQPLLSRRQSLFIIYAFIGVYLFLAGFDPPLVRASIMIGLVWLGMLLGRKTSSLWVLFLTCLIMLITSPLLLFSASFQLSVAATTGILLFGGALIDWLNKSFSDKSQFKFINLVSADFSQTLAAQLMVMPLLLRLFGQTSIWTIVSNLLVTPLVAPVMIGGLVVMVLSFIFWPLAQLLAWLLSFLLNYILTVASIFGNLNWGMIEFQFSWLEVGFIWLVLIYLAYKIEQNKI